MIGILPAGGTATRLYGLPKFLLPIGHTYLLAWHMEQQRRAGVERVYTFGTRATMPYLMSYVTPGMTLVERETPTVAEAVLHVRNIDAALFTMPDTYWDDTTLLPRLTATVDDGATVAVGLWQIRPDQHGQLGQCEVNGGRVIDLMDKTNDCPYPWVWGALAWCAAFWQFIQPGDEHLGMALKRAIGDGVTVRAVFAEGQYHDCGTFDGYARLCASMMEDVIYG